MIGERSPKQHGQDDGSQREPAIVQALIGDVRLLIGRGAPSEAEWDAHVRDAVAMDHAVRCVLVVVDGDGIPDAKSRAKLKSAGLLDKPTALLGPLSPLMRGMLTALHWLGAKMRGFPPAQFAEACDFLGIPAERRAELAERLASVRAPAPRTGSGNMMAAIRRTLRPDGPSGNKNAGSREGDDP